jgi:hypothetical protein
MSVYKYEIPIPDYDGRNVFFQELYIENNFCPTKEEVIGVLTKLHCADSQFEDYLGGWKKAIDSVDSCIEFPILSGSKVQSSRATIVKYFSKKIVEKITVNKLFIQEI